MSSIDALRSWGEQVKAMLKYKSVQDFYIHDRSYRFFHNGCILPFACFGCLCWSALWRTVFFPAQVARCDLTYACSDNDCTVCTDSCIDDAYRLTNMRRSLPMLMGILAGKYESEITDAHDRQYIAHIFDLIEQRFPAPSDADAAALVYVEVDHVAANILMESLTGESSCLPNQVASRVRMMRRDLKL
jgi:hypothetical protein